MMVLWNQLQHYQKALTPWQWAFAIVIVSVAIWTIVWLRSYFREDADDADETLEMLTQFNDLHQEGGLSDDEFRLIRSRLTHLAREALVADQKKPNARSVDAVLANSLSLHEATERQRSTQEAITEKEEKSERMSDD